jgi:hypothetical protein
MAFMEPKIEYGPYLEIETPDGTWFLPADVAGLTTDPAAVRDYVESMSDPADWTVTIKTGWIGRLTAPGYMDCTDWSAYDSEQEAIDNLTDDDDGDADADDVDPEDCP